MESRKTPITNEIAEDDTALQQLIRDKVGPEIPGPHPHPWCMPCLSVARASPVTARQLNAEPPLGDWAVGKAQFSDLQKDLPPGQRLCGVLVRVRSENGAVRVGGEMGSNVKTENVETGPRLEDEHYLLVVEPGNWCMTLGRPTYRLVLYC
jgi:hypothetical protein